jgi:hypothetical protein
MSYSWRLRTTAASKLPLDWHQQGILMAKRIGFFMQIYKVHPSLVVNMDQTGVHLAPVDSRTYDSRGVEEVRMIGADDKRQITACIASSLDGDLLPPLLPTLQTVLLSAAGLRAGQQPAAVVLEYHSDVDGGNAVIDSPMHLLSRSTTAASSTPERDMSQVALLSRFIDPATTKFVVLLTCGPYRKQLEAIRVASQRIYPNATFLLFDIEQLFVRDILSAVCSTVRHCLLYPHASPLHVAAEHFGKRLLQAYRPSFLFRGELLPIVHHSQDALTQCASGVTLKSRGQAHKAAGWEAFERFQLYRYSCKKSPSCGVCMLLPRC